MVETVVLPSVEGRQGKYMGRRQGQGVEDGSTKGGVIISSKGKVRGGRVWDGDRGKAGEAAGAGYRDRQGRVYRGRQGKNSGRGSVKNSSRESKVAGGRVSVGGRQGRV